MSYEYYNTSNTSRSVVGFSEVCYQPSWRMTLKKSNGIMQLNAYFKLMRSIVKCILMLNPILFIETLNVDSYSCV